MASDQELLVQRALGVSDYVVDKGRAMRHRLADGDWANVMDLSDRLRAADGILTAVESLGPDAFDGVLGGWERRSAAAARIAEAAPPMIEDIAEACALDLVVAIVRFTQEHPRL